MHVQIDFVLEQMTKQEFKYWRVLDNTQKTELRVFDDEAASLSDSLDELQHVYNNLTGGGFVYIQAYKYNNVERAQGGSKPKTYYIYKLQINNNGAGAGTNGGTGTGSGAGAGIDLARYLELLQENNKLQRQIEIEALKKSLEEKEPPAPGGLESFAKIILTDPQLKTAAIGFLNSAGKGIAGLAINGFSKKANNEAPPDPKKSGSHQTPNEPTNAELNDTLNEFSKVDPEYLTTLKNIVKFAKANPEQLEGIKNAIR
jgi:hypothetical protein